MKLGEVCEISAGDSAPQDRELFKDGSVPFVRTSDVGAIHFGSLKDSRDHLTEKGAAGLRRFRSGSILFPKSGASTFLDHRVLLEIEACVASHLAVITPSEQVDSRYLLLVLSQIKARDLLQDSSYPALRASEIEQIKIPLPPLSVQRDIVARLDAELAKADRMREEFLAIAENAAARFRAILAETFEAGDSGSSGFPGDSGSAAACPGSAADAACSGDSGFSGSGGVSRRSGASGSSGASGFSWPRVKLGEVCDLYQPHTLSLKQIAEGGPYSVYGANGIIGSHTEYNHEHSELVLGCRGVCGVVHITKPKSWINGNAMVVHPKTENISLEYLYYVFTEKAEELTQIATGAAQPQITRTLLAPIEIPLPPLSVQRSVVARLDAARAECDRAEALARKGAEECAGLRAALLKEAFE